MAKQWRIAPQLELSLRCWEDECALYVSPSGNTHILPRDLGVALQQLQRAPCRVESLAETAGLPLSLFAERLSALKQLGLIEVDTV